MYHPLRVSAEPHHGYPKRYRKNATIPPRNTSQAIPPTIPKALVSRDAMAITAELSHITEGNERLIHASAMVGRSPRAI